MNTLFWRNLDQKVNDPPFRSGLVETTFKMVCLFFYKEKMPQRIGRLSRIPPAGEMKIKMMKETIKNNLLDLLPGANPSSRPCNKHLPVLGLRSQGLVKPVLDVNYREPPRWNLTIAQKLHVKII